MTDDHPTILEQIDAVEWAEARIEAILPGAERLCARKLQDLRHRLEAAAETLRTLEFGSEIAR
jgi:hypothetical protein